MSHNVDWSDTSADPESICDNFLLLPTLIGILICLGRVLDQFFRRPKSDFADAILVPARSATFGKKRLWAVCGSFAVIAAAASIYGEMVLAPQSRISTSRQPLLFNQLGKCRHLRSVDRLLSVEEMSIFKDEITKSPVLSPLNFRLWTSAHATLFYNNLTSINESQVHDVDLDFSLEFLETNEVTGALAHEADYSLQTSHGVKCSQSYSTRQEVAILDCNDVQLYSKRSILEREVLHKINVTVRDVSLSVSDVSVLFSTINPKFTQTLIWLRFACLLTTFVAFLFFRASLKRLSPAKRLGEHKWLLLMFITLLLYQDPLFPLFFLLRWESLELIDELLQVTFFSMILLFWFSITHESEQSRSSGAAVPPKRAVLLVTALAIFTVILRMLEHSFHLESATLSIWLPGPKLTQLLNSAWITTALITLLYSIYRAAKVLVKEHKNHLESENVACTSAHVVNALVFAAIFFIFAFRQSSTYDFNEKLPVFWPALSPSYGCYQTIIPTIYLLSTSWLFSPVTSFRQLLPGG